ncbi:MAG: hypothetical protein JST54_04170 [Deltaproteobacteria bacterium]|nr:hypothetical protein [Deltaproteobacteria bacterium]
MKTLFAIVALGGALALGAVGCSSSNCGPGNCTGCCDANNNCQIAASDHCGANGAACATCTAAQSCVVGVCQFAGGNNGSGNGSGNNGSGNGNGSNGSTASNTTSTNGSSSTNSTNSTTGQTNTTGTNASTTTNGSTTGTSGSFDCSAKGPCQNDTTPTSSTIAQCQAAESDPNCGTQFLAYANCALTNDVCDSSGKSSLPSGACQTELTNYTNCIEAHSTTSGTTGTTSTNSNTSTTGTTATNSTTTTGTSTTGTTGSFCSTGPTEATIDNGGIGTPCTGNVTYADGGIELVQGSCAAGQYCFELLSGDTGPRCQFMCGSTACPSSSYCYDFSQGSSPSTDSWCLPIGYSDGSQCPTGYTASAPSLDPADLQICVPRCGGTGSACPANTTCLSNGECGCTNSAACGTGFTCDTASGACYIPCTSSTQCVAGGQAYGCCLQYGGKDFCDPYGQ